ncbi:MAG: hypothetical protein NC048_09875 [Bacteroides sp.]|nr:hypothetical protein [Bacteroides sp.]
MKGYQLHIRWHADLRQESSDIRDLLAGLAGELDSSARFTCLPNNLYFHTMDRVAFNKVWNIVRQVLPDDFDWKIYAPEED